MTGNRISDMTSLPSLGASGDEVPVIRSGVNYRFDLGAQFAAYGQRVSAAVGDGIADDRAALQAVIDVADTVILTPGKTYLIGYPGLSVASNKRIIGYGAILKLGAEATDVITVTGSNVELRGFTIDGQRATFTQTGNEGIFINWTVVAGANVHIEDVWVTETGGAGIMALASSGTATRGFTVHKSRITNTGAHGIIAQDYISDVKITHCLVENFGLGFADRPGITGSRYGSNVDISHNTVIGSAAALGESAHGISIDLTTSAVCDDNIISGCKGYGVEVGGVERGSVSNNQISDCERSGIGISGVEGAEDLFSVSVNITANNIDNCGSTGDGGIYAFVTTGTGAVMHQDIKFSNNTVTNCDGTGAQLNLINGLAFDPSNTIRGNGLSGLYLVDCMDIQIDGKVIGNNTANDAAHGGVRLISSLLSANQRVRWGRSMQVHSNGLADFFGGSRITTFTSTDATPSVKRGDHFYTANASATTITAFDDGVEGDEIVVVIDDANTTVDFTGTTLKGHGGSDWTPGVGDFMRCRLFGGNWCCDVVEI